MKRALLVWWFCIVTNGEAIFFEYMEEGACKVVQRAYERVGKHPTDCLLKGGESHGRLQSGLDCGRLCT